MWFLNALYIKTEKYEKFLNEAAREDFFWRDSSGGFAEMIIDTGK